MFMKHQGYHISSSVFYQDNESAIKLEKMAENRAAKSQDILTFDISLLKMSLTLS